MSTPYALLWSMFDFTFTFIKKIPRRFSEFPSHPGLPRVTHSSINWAQHRVMDGEQHTTTTSNSCLTTVRQLNTINGIPDGKDGRGQSHLHPYPSNGQSHVYPSVGVDSPVWSQWHHNHWLSAPGKHTTTTLAEAWCQLTDDKTRRQEGHPACINWLLVCHWWRTE